MGQFGCESDRVSQTINGITTNYVLDTALPLTQVLSDGTNTYLYGVDRIAQINGGIPEYFLTDGLGSVRQLVDRNGTVTLAKSYQPYGTEESSVGNGLSSYGFTGEMSDATGLIYLRSRYYASNAGRFITRDTWDGDANMPMSYNAWLYVYANPINLTDPSGHFPWPWEGTAIHIMIQNHYLANYGGGRVIVFEFPIPGGSKEVTGNDGEADIADLTLRQIYEIKPIELDLEGEQDLYWYLSHLPAAWGPGTHYPYTDTYIGPWPNNPNKEVHAAMHIPGVIAYWDENRRPDNIPLPLPLIIPEKKKSTQQNYSPGLQPAPGYRCAPDWLLTPSLPWGLPGPTLFPQYNIWDTLFSSLFD